MASLPELSDGIALTHVIVAADVEHSARFYSDVLGGEIALAGEPVRGEHIASIYARQRNSGGFGPSVVSRA